MVKMRLYKALGKMLRSSPSLYRCCLLHYRIRKKAADQKGKDVGVKEKHSEIKKETEIRTFRELLSGMDTDEAAVYGREIIEAYRDDPEKSILLISHDMSISGAPIVLLHMGCTLKKLGYQVIVMAPPGEERSISDALGKGTPVVIYNALFESDIVLRLAGMFSVIVCNTVVTFPVIMMLSKTRHRVIWWIHEGLSGYSRETARIWPEKLPDNIRVYTVGEYARKALVVRYPKYRVNNLIYWSPDVMKKVSFAEKRLNRSCGRRVYAHIGGMSLRKGSDILVKAIRLLPETTLRSCIFIFAGIIYDSMMETLLMNLRKDYPNQIIVTGEIPLTEVYQLYLIIDYLVCPSRDDPMPVVIAEAMSMGIPAICSEHMGSAEIIRKYESGYVYAPDCAWRLKEEIVKTFNLPKEEYEMLSRNARNAYEHEFTEAVFEERIKEVIDFRC